MAAANSTPAIPTADVGDEVEVSRNTNFSVASIIDSMQSGVGVFSTIVGDDFETRVKVLNAVTDSTPLEDKVGGVINLRNYIVQSVELQDSETGELVETARVVLIDDDGTAYHAISKGAILALRALSNILPAPHTWPRPVAMRVLKEGQAGRRYFTLKFA